MANQYVNKFIKDGVVKLDLTSDTVTPETLDMGVTAHNKAGQAITGTVGDYLLISADEPAAYGLMANGYLVTADRAWLIGGV